MCIREKEKEREKGGGGQQDQGHEPDAKVSPWLTRFLEWTRRERFSIFGERSQAHSHSHFYIHLYL